MNPITQELLRISKENNGILRPEDIVTEAQSKGSPLHDSFTWDDGEAAHLFRLQEARQLIRVSVQFIKSGNKQVETRVFVSLTNDRQVGGGYRTLISVMNDDEMRQQLLADCVDEMNRFQEKYKNIKELIEVFQAMNRIQKNLKKQKVAA